MSKVILRRKSSGRLTEFVLEPEGHYSIAGIDKQYSPTYVAYLSQNDQYDVIEEVDLEELDNEIEDLRAKIKVIEDERQ